MNGKRQNREFSVQKTKMEYGPMRKILFSSRKTPFQTPFPSTPGAPQIQETNTPMTPNTQGVLQGAKSKTGQQMFRFKSTKVNKQKDPKDPPVTKTWAQTAALNIPKEIMQVTDNSTYVELLVEKNNIVANHVTEAKAPKKPKVAADMEKIASIIGIKNITWS